VPLLRGSSRIKAARDSLQPDVRALSESRTDQLKAHEIWCVSLESLVAVSEERN